MDAVRALARICSDALIANVLNRNGLRTGRGNFWTRERVTALRSHHEIPVYSRQSGVTEGWLNLTEAARLHRRQRSHAPTGRRATARSTAEHPLADGPWIFHRDALGDAKTSQRSSRALVIASGLRYQPRNKASSIYQ